VPDVTIIVSNTQHLINLEPAGPQVIEVETDQGISIEAKNAGPAEIQVTQQGPRIIEVSGPQGPIGPPGGAQVEWVTLSAPQVAAKQITLSGSPTYPNRVQVLFAGGPAQAYGVDYTVSGLVLSWSGLGMETLVEAGDTLIIEY
jgi:hypothetical protein